MLSEDIGQLPASLMNAYEKNAFAALERVPQVFQSFDRHVFLCVLRVDYWDHKELDDVLAYLASVAEPVKVEETLAVKKQADAKKKEKPVEPGEDDENAKDGVVLDELFKMKPEIFQSNEGGDEESAGDKKKGKKGKKKAVELQYDEDLGEVVGRKIHKRGGDDGNDW